MPETPEQRARREIDLDLTAAGWIVQSRDELDITAGRGVAVREFQMRAGFGFADYLLYLDRKAVGAVEAKPEGTLTGVEAQSAKYAAGLPENLPAQRRPLPFLFESNGSVTYFTNGLDPAPRSRQVFNFPRLRLDAGDILIVEGNGSRSEIGRCAVWSGNIPDCVHQNHIIRVRPITGLLPKYADLFLNSPTGQRAIQSVASSTSGLYTLSISKIERLPLALPPFAEQEVVVEAAEDLLSVLEHVEADLETKLKSAQSLRQAILRHAFSGKLVPQDPNDEPASELLKRIVAEREVRERKAGSVKTRKARPAAPRKKA